MKKVHLKELQNVKFGKNVVIKAKEVDISGCDIGNGVSICGDKVTIQEGVQIGDNVSIEATNILVGSRSKIEKETVIRGLGKRMDSFVLGDNAFIGFRNQILVPYFEMLDYSQLHNSGLHSGYAPLTIGYNCWIGQNTILNATERLQIGNNVRIGTQSQLWTHVASGELLEGCTLFGQKPLVLKDNVWLVGGAVISPGLVLGENSIIMTGAVLTRDTSPFSTFAGVPAVDVTNKLNFWKKISLEDKYILIKKFASEFIVEFPEYKELVHVKQDVTKEELRHFSHENLIIVKQLASFDGLADFPASIFDLSSKQYLKKRTQIELDWVKFNVGFRARFIPFLGINDGR